MTCKINRRDFIKSATMGAAAALISGPAILRSSSKTTGIDICVVTGNPFEATQKAIELLADIKTFIPPKSSVGLLINAPSWWKNPGSYTHPDIVLAVVNLCYKAGASEIHYLIDPAGNYWQKSKLFQKYAKEIQTIKSCSGNYVEKEILLGKSLKKVKIIKELFECDVFINLPINKHHTGTHISGNLKNMMGANTHASNQFFHHGSGTKKSYDDVDFLSQCIADLNTLRKPTLCVTDAWEFLTTNGPAGPGNVRKLGQIVAGTDPVAVDAYCSILLGHQPSEIKMIQKAHDLGLGKMNLKNVSIKKVSLKIFGD